MKTKLNVLLIVNPIAGNSDKSEVIQAVTQRTNALNYSLQHYTTTGEDDAKAIKEYLTNREIHIVLVAGGDGTVSMVADIVKEYEITLGILPVGSANGLATNFKIPQDLQEQLTIAFGDHFVAMDVLQLNDRICLHIADLGINAELIENYDNSSIRGKIGYFIQSIPTLIQSNHPFQFKIQCNGTEITRQGVLLAIANANTFGTGARINPNGKINDGKFEVLVFKELNFLEILKTFKDNNPHNPEFVEIVCTDEVRIECRENVSFQIDGEYIGKVTTVKAVVHPKKLKLAIPQDDTQE